MSDFQLPDSLKDNYVVGIIASAFSALTVWWARKDKKEDKQLAFDSTLMSQLTSMTKTIEELRAEVGEKHKEIGVLKSINSKLIYKHNDAAWKFNILYENIDEETMKAILPKEKRGSVEFLTNGGDRKE